MIALADFIATRPPTPILKRLYDGLWYLVLPFALLFSGISALADLRQRLGLDPAARLPANASLRIWAHAASVGEVEALRPVLEELARLAPDVSIIVTTMTRTGRAAARVRIPSARAALLAPFDAPSIVRRFLDSSRPHLVLIAETELWPNYFVMPRRIGARVAIVNGRLSDRATRGYLRVRPLFADALCAADLILAQTADDARRYIALGAPPEIAIVTGNTKHESALAPPLRPALAAFAPTRPVMVAGSTAPGEEQAVLEAFAELRRLAPALALVVAPRHPQRFDEAAELIRESKFHYIRASTLAAESAPTGAMDADVMLLDTIGDLRALYRRAKIAFIGGSLTPGRGGQSLAEPASASLPVLFGPFHENHTAVANALLEAGGGCVVSDARELAAAARRWLLDDGARIEAGLRARAVVDRMSGGATATVAHLRRLLGA